MKHLFFYRKGLLVWFVNNQLQEYAHLFDENQNFAWLDKSKIYMDFKEHLLDFETKFGAIFSQDWEISERIAVQFCHITCEDLIKLTNKKRNEIDIKLLLYFYLTLCGTVVDISTTYLEVISLIFRTPNTVFYYFFL